MGRSITSIRIDALTEPPEFSAVIVSWLCSEKRMLNPHCLNP